MSVYTWLVVLLVAAAIVFKGTKKHSRKFIIVAFILLFAVMGLRDVKVTGNDASGSFGSYALEYWKLSKVEWGEIYDAEGSIYNIGFTYLTKLMYGLTGGEYQWYVAAISFFVMFSYMRFISKYSPSPFFSVMCFLGLLYYSLLFDVLKQAVAMSILLFAFDAIVEKRPLLFLVLIIVAAFFHFPALIFLPAYWIGRMKLGRGYIALLAGLLLLTYALRDSILKLMLDSYGEGDIEASMEGIRFLRNKVIIMIVFAVLAVIIRPPRANDTIYNALLIFTGVAIVFQTFCGYNNIFERLADYYFHTSIVLVPMIFEKIERPGIRIETRQYYQLIDIATVGICLIAAWRFLSYVNDSWMFNQFRFFWQG